MSSVDALKRDSEWAEKLRAAAENEDTESAHIIADRTLVELLESLGYHKTVKAFKSIPKWYA